MDKTIAIIPGNGISPEIMTEAVKVLKGIEAIFGHRFINRDYAPACLFSSLLFLLLSL